MGGISSELLQPFRVVFDCPYERIASVKLPE